MPRSRVPSYCLHKPTGQAYVTLPVPGAKGRVVYLGRHGSDDSRARYRATIAAWLADPSGPPEPRPSGPTVAEVGRAYLAHAEAYYRKGGEPTSQVGLVLSVSRILAAECGEKTAREFTAADYRAVRARFVASGLSRVGCNRRARIVTQMFRWAVSEGLAPDSAWTACRSVDGLKRGRTEARETEPVRPVAVEDVDRTLPFLPRPIAAMVRLQLLTGMRPGEACILRACDIEDLDRRTWTYHPERHKTEHHGRGRSIPLGPQAQAIVRPFLAEASGGYIFSPRRWMAERAASRRAARTSKVQPSQVDRSDPAKRRVYAERYNKDSYRNAVARACGQAGVTAWHPNQLRHAYATDVRRRFGLEAAQVLLGHASADVTQIYAERDADRAAAIAAEIG
ncbi:tyrosine-type recombinase/integrase [Paludisphaera soli]|uniref:tyrosine-type recombinase/integrase n=1 Tax=Paludisphaera soli TaxID=2712865 RepID=UPI0013EBAB69|nr:site-specific integrase [Paludisphaera soli]